MRGAGSVHPGAIVTPFPGIGAIGRNTGHIIHPGGILADDSALMVTGRGVESPVVLRRLSRSVCAFLGFDSARSGDQAPLRLTMALCFLTRSGSSRVPSPGPFSG